MYGKPVVLLAACPHWPYYSPPHTKIPPPTRQPIILVYIGLQTRSLTFKVKLQSRS